MRYAFFERTNCGCQVFCYVIDRLESPGNISFPSHRAWRRVRRGNGNSQNEPGMCLGINSLTFRRLTFTIADCEVGGWRILGGVCHVCVQRLMVTEVGANASRR